MYDHELFLQTLAQSTLQQLLTPYEVPTALDQLAHRVTDVLGLSGSGVSLVHRDRLVFQTAHDSGISLVARAQEQSQSGPCVIAYRTGQAFAVEDVAQERSRWPAFCKTAAAVGVTAVASIPMTLGEETIGVVGLYSRRARDWPEDDLAAASTMANMATAFLVHGAHDRQQVDLAAQLQHALSSRVVLEQAKGVLAASGELEMDVAFAVLRRYARDHGRRLSEVAAEVVGRRLQGDVLLRHARAVALLPA